MGERTVRIRKVVGSIPIRSTISRKITANLAVIFRLTTIIPQTGIISDHFMRTRAVSTRCSPSVFLLIFDYGDATDASLQMRFFRGLNCLWYKLNSFMCTTCSTNQFILSHYLNKIFNDFPKGTLIVFIFAMIEYFCLHIVIANKQPQHIPVSDI